MLRKNIPLTHEFSGDEDADTIHLGTFKDDQLIAVASFMKSSHENFDGLQYQLRGMATLSTHRGLGAGKLIVIEIQRRLKKLAIEYLWCKARIVALDFYKKQGFEIFGDPFEIAHIGVHYIMFKKIK